MNKIIYENSVEHDFNLDQRRKRNNPTVVIKRQIDVDESWNDEVWQFENISTICYAINETKTVGYMKQSGFINGNHVGKQLPIWGW